MSTTGEAPKSSEALLQAREVTYEVGGRNILYKVSATFEPKNLTGILGPSGTGKSSLLNTLAGRVSGKRRGSVLVNGVPTSLQKMRKLLSFMPQDDILYMQLTVKQSIVYAALMRSPREWTYSRKIEAADNIISTLGLRRVADQKLSEVSGGQRKRCSAAIEFLSGRPILFMDEPTSGLDSATATALVDQLRQAAHLEQRTVVATIHQPSWDLLSRFDKLLILASLDDDKGGTVVFDSAPSQLSIFFANAGSPCPEGENPADHVMYVLAEDGGTKWRELWRDSPQKIETDDKAFAALDRIQQQQNQDTTLSAGLVSTEKDVFLRRKGKTMYSSDEEDDDDDDDEEDEESAMQELRSLLSNATSSCSSGRAVIKKKRRRYPISFWEQYLVLFKRTAHIWLIDRQQAPLIFKMLFGAYTVLILILCGMPMNLSKANAVFYLVVIQFTMSMTPLVIIMPEERGVVLREYRNGVFSASAYWLARFTLAVSHAAVNALITTFYFYPLAGLPTTPLSKFSRWYLFQLLYLSCVMMLGMTVGVLSPSALVGIKIIVAIQIPWLVSSGILPPFARLRPELLYFHYPNLFTWAAKLALTISFDGAGEKAENILHYVLHLHPGNANGSYQVLALAFVLIFFCGLIATHHALRRPDAVAGVRGRGSKKGSENIPSPKASTTTTPIVSSAVTEKPSVTLTGLEDDIQASAVNPLLDRLLYEGDDALDNLKQDASTSLLSSAAQQALKKSSGYGALEEMEAGAACVSLELRGVNYRFPDKPQKKALDNVDLLFEGGTITMMAGPSGAGKSTLLNLLAGRLPIEENSLEGEVYVDGQVATADLFREIGTLTPQDEILPAVLTVRQTLKYIAELRSPRHWSRAQRLARVESIIQKLGLSAKADNVIGNSLKVGLSGGQKKRLSIGMDLLAELPVMLVDEPTTGLDANAALSVVRTLIRLATDQRRTIISTIHQPPWTMVLQFDQLVLLSRGSVVYDGPPADLPTFLSAAGRPPPPEENPCDFVMMLLVTAGNDKWITHRAKLEDDDKGQKRVLATLGKGLDKDEALGEDSTAFDEEEEETSFLGLSGVIRKILCFFFTFKKKLSTVNKSSYRARRTSYSVSQRRQAWILFRRCAYILCIDEDQLPEILFPSLIAATIVGFSFRDFGVNYFLAAGVLMALIAHGMIILNGTVLNMPSERDLIVREYHNGTYSIAAYWIARASLSLLLSSVIGIPMMCISYPLIGLTRRPMVIIHYYLASFLNASIFSLMALFLGLVNKTALASAQIAEPLGGAMTIFSGALVTKHFTKPILMPVFYAFPISYALEIALSAILEHKGEDGIELLSYYSFKPANRHFDYAILVAMLFAWILIGFVAAVFSIESGIQDKK